MIFEFGVSEYPKEDYLEIYKHSVDKDQMEETWEAWKENKDQKVKEMKTDGRNTIDVIVYAEELIRYCRENGLELNGEARAQFVSVKMAKE